jgi:hypothetical protein
MSASPYPNERELLKGLTEEEALRLVETLTRIIAVIAPPPKRWPR